MSTSTPAADKPYPLPGLIAFSTVGIPLAGMLLAFGLWTPRYYVTLLHKGGMHGAAALALVGLAFLVIRLIDICIDPLVALAMDRTRTPIGRYRPWMILSLPFLIIGIHQVLIPGPHANIPALIGWLTFTYIGYSMLTLAQTSWSATLATSYSDRSRLFGWTQGLAVIGSVGLLVLPIVTRHAIVPSTAKDLPKVALILMIALPVTLAICIWPSPCTRTPHAAGSEATVLGGRLPVRRRAHLEDRAGRPGADARSRHHRADVRLLLP